MKNDVVAIIEKTDEKVERKVTLNNNVKAPIEQGAVLGKIEFLIFEILFKSFCSIYSFTLAFCLFHFLF